MKRRKTWKKWALGLLVLVAGVGLWVWSTGVDELKERWDFWNRGKGSVSIVEEFYRTLLKGDSEALLKFFSEETMQGEGRQEIVQAIAWGMDDRKTTSDNVELRHFKIADKKMLGDTALVQVALTNDLTEEGLKPAKTVSFLLVKQKGEWKIALPQKAPVAEF